LLLDLRWEIAIISGMESEKEEAGTLGFVVARV